MDRLTNPNFTKACCDPWDYCGLDKDCRRDCKGCKLPAQIYRLAMYEDTGLEPEEVKSIKETWDLFGGADGIQRAYTERDKYKQAESEGRLIVLPCKVGDMVYAIRYLPWAGNAVKDVKVLAIGAAIRENKTIVIVSSTKDDVWGETVFPTSDEAEAALGGADNG